MVPVIELMDGRTGVIDHIGIYDNRTIIYLPDSTSFIVYGSVKECFLSDLRDDDLTLLAQRQSIPFDELQELRTLEAEYRASLHHKKL